MQIEVEFARVLIRETSDSHVVELREKDGDRALKILIGWTEAAAIERLLLGEAPPRPQTHELIAAIVEGLEARFEKLVINDLRHDELGRGTFYARLYVRQGDKVVDFDARPSDAIAMVVGVEAGVPIYVEDHVLAAAAEEA